MIDTLQSSELCTYRVLASWLNARPLGAAPGPRVISATTPLSPPCEVRLVGETTVTLSLFTLAM